jgi:hypothetical protein
LALCSSISPGEICVYAKVFFLLTRSGTDTVTYQWSFGTGTGNTTILLNSGATTASTSGVYICNTGTTGNQFMMQDLGDVGSAVSLPAVSTTTSVDTTVAETLSLQGNSSGTTDKVTPYMLVVSAVQ